MTTGKLRAQLLKQNTHNTSTDFLVTEMEVSVGFVAFHHLCAQQVDKLKVQLSYPGVPNEGDVVASTPIRDVVHAHPGIPGRQSHTHNSYKDHIGLEWGNKPHLFSHTMGRETSPIQSYHGEENLTYSVTPWRGKPHLFSHTMARETSPIQSHHGEGNLTYLVTPWRGKPHLFSHTIGRGTSPIQ